MRRLTVVLVVFLLSWESHASERVAPIWFPAEASEATLPAPAAQRSPAAEPVAVVERLHEGDIAAIRAWNESGQVPAKIGLFRALPDPVVVSAHAAAMTGGDWSWRGAVTITGADRIRLRLRDVVAPQGARFRISSNRGETIAFDAVMGTDGLLWTPSVEGETATLEVNAGSNVSFQIDGAMDIRRPVDVGIEEETYCLSDLSCQSTELQQLGTAIAHMQFVSGGNVYICSGGLLNDRGGTGTPFFLTANHCVSTSSEAASLETFWDYRSSSCLGIVPALSSRPRVSGATLLATSESTDVTLLRLPTKPSGSRTYLGWDPGPVAGGTLLRRVSHPKGLAQKYSSTSLITSGSTCSGASRPQYLYSTLLTGGALGGSSGAPVFYGEGYVVGQLLGACGSNPGEGCSTANRVVDGALSASWPLLKPHLDPASPETCSACTPSADTACLLGNRFRVTMTWRDFSANLQGKGSTIKYADNKPEVHPQFGPLSESAFFSMYSHAPNSIETLVRMIKGQTINDHYWVFMTGFAGAEYTVRVQDTKTCRVWQRTSTSGATNMTKDFEAFPFP